MSRTRSVLLLLATIALIAPVPVQAQQRPLTPDDLFRIEEIGDIAISPDGRSVAYVHRRPIAGHKEFQQGFLAGNDRADIWLADVAGGAPRNLTNGIADGSGYWSPVWSPDGSRLAMLSTKGGHVRLWVWNKADGTLSAWSPRSIQTVGAPPFAWIDNQRLAAILLAEGENPQQMTVERRAATVAMREWPKTWAGTETTASVIDSGVPATLDKRPQMQLAILTGTGAPQVVGSAYSVRDLRIGPANSYIAALSQVAMLQPDPRRLLQHGASNRFASEDRYELIVADPSGKPAPRPELRVHVVPSSLQWSADGGSLAFVGAAADDDGFTLYRAERSGAVRAVPLRDLDPRTVIWTARGDLLLLADRKTTEGGREQVRPDWWLIVGSDSPRNLTSSLKSAPADLLPEQGRGTLVGVADGDLWRIDPSAGSATNLTGGFEPKIASIVWPSATVPRHAGFDRVVVGVQRESLLDLHLVRLASGEATPFERPSANATLAAYRPDSEVAVFTANEPNGTFLTVAPKATAARTLVKTNEFLSGIGEGQLKQIDYRSTDGQDLKAWVLYPPGYKQGTRYPVVTWVYAGSVTRETPSLLTRLNISHPLSLQLLAARGYVVLLPSMPLAPEREASDPYMELPKGVLPALDKLVDLGVADPARLAVMGQSYGGYSTYGLITQTNRFKAAISLAGLNDLVSLYGIFDMRSRYEPYPHERLFSQSIAESGQIRMGNPPWKDAGRYLRNSPLFYVDRVQTPLLIIQGDMDYVALQQGEQFFTALYRQGKRARFARYWGEGHVFSSPANIRDMWKQIYAWLDEFLAEKAPKTGTQLEATGAGRAGGIER